MTAISQGAKPIIAARFTGPGPGRYMLPTTFGYKQHDYTRYMAPAYSFGIKLVSTFWRGSQISPGPVYFVDPKYTRFGRDGTPEYSMLARAHDLDFFKTPGPGTYDNEKCHPPNEPNAPMWSMTSRTRYRLYDSNPAPNAYTLPNMLGPNVIGKESCPCYSIQSRSRRGAFDEDLAKTPGPAGHDPANTNVYKEQAPIYSMLERRYEPADKTIKPGPGAHSPENVIVNKPIPPHYSFGIRHSEFITPLITEADVDDFFGD